MIRRVIFTAVSCLPPSEAHCMIDGRQSLTTCILFFLLFQARSISPRNAEAFFVQGTFVYVKSRAELIFNCQIWLFFYQPHPQEPCFSCVACKTVNFHFLGYIVQCLVQSITVCRILMHYSVGGSLHRSLAIFLCPTMTPSVRVINCSK